MDARAYFESIPGDPRRFRATDATVGPWDRKLQHGSPPAALLARAIETALPKADARIARLAYDFHGAVPVAELAVDVEPVRPGARIDLSSARLRAGERVVMEARAWRIATQPERAPAVRDGAKLPPLPAAASKELFGDVPSFGYGESLEWRFVEGAFDQLGPAAVWARTRLPLVAGEETSPLGRLLLMVDSANGISAELPPSRFQFVPVGLTVALTRHPRTEWVGMRARTTIDPDGVGLVRADLFDEEGFLGVASQTLFVAPR